MLFNPSSLWDHIPPPRFLYMPAEGVDLADRKVRFVRLSRRRGHISLDGYAEQVIEPGLLVSGEIKKPKELQTVLKKFAKTHGIQFAHVPVPEEKVYLSVVETQKLKGEELRNALFFNLEEYVPLSPREATFDYEILGVSPQDPNKQDVLVAAIKTDDVLAYWDLFKGAGITPISFEIESQAIARASVPENDTATRVVVDIGHVRTALSLVRSGVVQFTATLDVGSQAFTDSLAKNFDISEEEAERMKNTRSVSTSDVNRDFVAALLPTLSVFRDEINNLLVYARSERSHTHVNRVKNIILSGGGANLKGLPEYLSQYLNVPAEVGNPWENVVSFEKYVPPIPRNRALGYSATIGLALGNILYD